MTIVADGASASNNGTLMTFTGRVKTNIPPLDAGPAATAEMKGNQP